MARRKKKNDYGESLAAIIVLIIIGAIGSANIAPVIGVIVFVIVIGYIAFHWIGFSRKKAYMSMLEAVGVADPMQLNPIDYERFCGILLNKSGWRTTETPMTRDFGADIIAYRGSIKMVVQCKRYSKPVGISAIQEVHAAARYYKANDAAVMATSGFTKSAKLLAEKTGTKLIIPGKKIVHDDNGIIKV